MNRTGNSAQRARTADINPDVLPPENRSVGRPSNLLKLVGVKSLPERATQIREYHVIAGTSYLMSAFYAVMTGFELLAARSQVPHGKWLEWIKANCPFSEDSATRYMQAAERKTGQMSNSAHVRNLISGRSPQELGEAERVLLIEAVKDATAGETSRQMMLDLGILKEAAPKGGHHPRKDDGLSADEKRDAKEREALAEWKVIEKALSLWVSKHKYERISNLDIQQARQVLQAALALIPDLKG